MRKIQIISLVLCLIMLLSAVSCAKDNGSTETTPAVQNNDTTTAPSQDSGSSEGETTASEETERVDANGYLMDDLDPTLNYGGEEFTLLYWSDREMEEFYVEGETGDLVNDALYNRNMAVQERLGITFAYATEKGNGSNVHPFTQKVSASISAGDHAYDMVAAHSVTIGLCAAQDLLYDLNEVEHIDYDKPWWPETLINEATVNDKLLFASGDISANVLYMMYVTFFNKTMLESCQLEDPYELVKEGKWTLDKMISMSKNLYADLNGNAAKDTDDQYGLTITPLHSDAFLTGSGITTLDNAGGTLSYNADFLGEKTQNLQEKLQSFLNDSPDGLLSGSASNINFSAGKSLFWIDRCKTAITFSSTDLSYGIVPVPKYDEDQENYRSVIGNPFSLYAIPKDSMTADMAGAVMECMASESYRTVSPALYEVSLKLKYSQDDVASQMFDIVKSTVVFDLGRIFLRSLDAPFERWQGALSGNTAWLTLTKSSSRVWEKKLEKLLEIYQ